MEIEHAVTALSALAQETRLAIYRYLLQAGTEGVPAGRIGEHFGIPAATLSFHLRTLKQAGLVHCQREGRVLRYSAHFDQMNALLDFLMENCCAASDETCAVPRCALPPNLAPDPKGKVMNERKFNILFLCTGNSARSILAESLMNHWGRDKFMAYSAGSMPTGKVNPYALDLLNRLHMPVAGARSKSWDEFADPGAPHLDFVVTVCDNAAGEVCPVWPGQPITSHWGVPDPAAVEGSDTEKTQAFREAFRVLENRIKIFASLPLASLDRLKIKDEMDEIGKVLPDIPAGPPVSN